MADPVVRPKKLLTWKALTGWLDSCCPVCGVPHDDEIHEAVLRLCDWLRTKASK